MKQRVDTQLINYETWRRSVRNQSENLDKPKIKEGCIGAKYQS